MATPPSSPTAAARLRLVMLASFASVAACNLLLGLDGDTQIVASAPNDASDGDALTNATGDAAADTSNTGELVLLSGDLGGSGFRDGPAKLARFGLLTGVAEDTAGNVYVVDSKYSVIRKVAAGTLEVSTFAGRAGERGTADGILSTARFEQLESIVFDGQHTLYLSESDGEGFAGLGTDRCVIRRIDLSTATVSTVAGGACGLEAAGPGIPPLFGDPKGLAVANGSLYIADRSNHRVRKYDPLTGQITTFCGTGQNKTAAGTCGSDAALQFPSAMVADPTGAKLYVTAQSGRIVVAELFGSLTLTVLPLVETIDGGTQAATISARSVERGNGRLFAANGFGHIRQVDLASSLVYDFVGDSAEPKWVDGDLSVARFEAVNAISARDRANGLYLIADAFAVRLMTPQQIETLAGRGTVKSFADGLATNARFARDILTTYDEKSTTVYIYDAGNRLIRALDVATNSVRTIAGVRGAPFNIDGDSGATSTFSDEPESIVYDGNGHLYISDPGEALVRRVDVATGATTTLKTLSLGLALTLAPDGQFFYFGKGAGILKWNPATPTKTAEPVAGVSSTTGTADGVGLAARFLSVTGLCLDQSINALIIADRDARTIRKLDLGTNIVSTLAGTPGQSAHVDGIGVEARFTGPLHVGCTGNGQAFVADTASSTLRRIDLATGAVTTVAGAPSQHFIEPGPLPASLNAPTFPIAIKPDRIIVTSQFESALVEVHLRSSP